MMDVTVVVALIGASAAATATVLKVVIPAITKRKSQPPQAADSPMAAAQAQAEVLRALAALTLVLAKIEAQHAETEAALERLANAISKQTEVLYKKIEIAVETNLQTKAVARRLDTLQAEHDRILEVMSKVQKAH